MISGDLFPEYIPDKGAPGTESSGISSLFHIRGVSYKDYGKLIFWSFVAGFSEHFVTNIISRFKSGADTASQHGRVDRNKATSDE